ncbi:MAG: CheY-like chemotaxis protein [Saprospiraceae bacterium]|jgi:CheY-like chemotaxis protein
MIYILLFFWKRESRRLKLENQFEIDRLETERLRDLDRTKARFFANISHEFRTPLTVISGMAEQMENNPKEWFEEGVIMIKRNSDRLLDLVNKMLDLSKLETGKIPVHHKESDILTHLKYLVESIHSLAQSKEIKVHFLAEEDHIMMAFDPDKVQQLMTNLLSNAIKFTNKGGDIYLTARSILTLENGIYSTESMLPIKVKDTGVGINEDQIPYIFDRFYQVDDSNTRSKDGTGIGLSLVLELVKLMEGSISVKSKLGKGTEFTILLPIKHVSTEGNMTKASSAVNPPISNIPASITSSKLLVSSKIENGENSNNSKPRILLVDDNHDVAAYIASCLQQDYTIYVGNDGQEGIDIALESIPDLIITDVMMPLKDGYELCETLKADELTSHIPIIILTAKVDLESRLEGLGKGADAYLDKPFHKKELIIRIQNLLELRQNL